MRQDPKLYTVETVRAKVGRSPSFVYQRLKLAELTPSVQKSFYESKLTAGHATETARLQPTNRKRASQECFPGHRTTGASSCPTEELGRTAARGHFSLDKHI
jgi:hypothetical protein